jgi:dimethylaniline monooxygenase (N-oxide forming)
LQPHFRLNVPIQQVTFDADRKQWVVKIDGDKDQYFDKVVIAIGGMVGQPSIPSIPGLDLFQGTNIHAKSFKRPQDFAGKRVMVVGFGNSAADTSTQLVGIANKIYLAHRHGARVLPRMHNGRPIDHGHSVRMFSLASLIMKYFPHFGERQFDKFMKSFQDKHFALKPEWGFEPAQKVPMVSDTLVDHLHAGAIESVPGVKCILNPTTIELDNGRHIEVDTIIWCTGYKSDFSIIDPNFDPTAAPNTSWSNARGSNNKSLFNLYLNVFSAKKPDSLAFIGNVYFALGGFHIFDMAAMAISQVFKGTSRLPAQPQLEREIEKQHEWIADLASIGYNVSPGNVEGGPWMDAMNELGGTGVNEHLGYGWKGWWFWIRNVRLCNLLMGGVWSPCIYRVFETGKRKSWEGAPAAIEKANMSPRAKIA